jgi:hypothetical protein
MLYKSSALYTDHVRDRQEACGRVCNFLQNSKGTNKHLLIYWSLLFNLKKFSIKIVTMTV